MYLCQPQSPDSFLPFFPAWCPYIFYVCVSVSTLQIGSSVPFTEERLLTFSVCPSRTVTLLCLVRSWGRLETVFPQTWAPLPSEVGLSTPLPRGLGHPPCPPEGVQKVLLFILRKSAHAGLQFLCILQFEADNGESCFPSMSSFSLILVMVSKSEIRVGGTPSLPPTPLAGGLILPQPVQDKGGRNTQVPGDTGCLGR